MLLDDIEHAVYQQFLRMGFATLIVTLVMIGLSVEISRAVIQPLDTIKDVMKNVAKTISPHRFLCWVKMSLVLLPSLSITVLPTYMLP